MPKLRKVTLSASGQGGKKKDWDELLKLVQTDARSVTYSSKFINNQFFTFVDALSRNRLLTEINLPNNDLTDENIELLMTKLHDSGNIHLRSLDLSGNLYTKKAYKYILEYVEQHLHLINLKFDEEPRKDMSSSNPIVKKSNSILRLEEIKEKMESNRKMNQFLKRETTRFECQCRMIVVMQGFINTDWGARMTALDLTGNRLFHVPNLLTTFHCLEELLLASNDLTKLPAWIGCLTQLRIIDATNNGIRYIPESVSSLSRLQTLNLSNNTITRVPLFIATLPNLTIFSINVNPVENVPKEIVQTADYGNPTILEYLRNVLHVSALHLDEQITGQSNSHLSDILQTLPINMGWILENLSASDKQVIEQYYRQEKDRLDDTPTLGRWRHSLMEGSVLKHVYSQLGTTTDSPALILRKVSDSIWCGTENGAVYIWDARTSQLRNNIYIHSKAIVGIVDVIPFNQVWTADEMGNVRVYDTVRKDVTLFPSLPTVDDRILLSPDKKRAVSMCFLPSMGQIWIALDDTIHRVNLVTMQVLEAPVKMDSIVTVMLESRGNHVWIACEDGTIVIYDCNMSEVYKVILAHSHRIDSLINVDEEVWSLCSEEKIIKIWRRAMIRFGVYLISCCLMIVMKRTYTEVKRLTAATDGSCVFALCAGESECFLQLSKSGTVMDWFVVDHKHNRNKISGICFSPSPDRLWSCALDGSVFMYEVKRGTKTIKRLEALEQKKRLAEAKEADFAAFAKAFNRVTMYNDIEFVIPEEDDDELSFCIVSESGSVPNDSIVEREEAPHTKEASPSPSAPVTASPVLPRASMRQLKPPVGSNPDIRTLVNTQMSASLPTVTAPVGERLNTVTSRRAPTILGISPADMAQLLADVAKEEEKNNNSNNHSNKSNSNNNNNNTLPVNDGSDFNLSPMSDEEEDDIFDSTKDDVDFRHAFNGDDSKQDQSLEEKFETVTFHNPPSINIFVKPEGHLVELKVPVTGEDESISSLYDQLDASCIALNILGSTPTENEQNSRPAPKNIARRPVPPRRGSPIVGMSTENIQSPTTTAENIETNQNDHKEDDPKRVSVYSPEYQAALDAIMHNDFVILGEEDGDEIFFGED